MTNDKPTFKHDLKKVDGSIDINEVGGYTKCLKSLLRFLEEETNFNPDKRFIDSVNILDRITNTNAELSELMREVKSNLQTIS